MELENPGGSGFRELLTLGRVIQAYGSDLAGHYVLCHRLENIHLAWHKYCRSLRIYCVKNGRITNVRCMVPNLPWISRASSRFYLGIGECGGYG